MKTYCVYTTVKSNTNIDLQYKLSDECDQNNTTAKLYNKCSACDKMEQYPLQSHSLIQLHLFLKSVPLKILPF